MPYQLPSVDTTTAQELLELAQDKAVEVSGGRLSDRSAASPLTAILEAVAVVGTQVVGEVNNLATTLETNRISLFGIERREGIEATGTVELTLNGVYADPFYLGKGFELTFNGIAFETIADLIIPAYNNSGRVTISALEVGSVGNLPQSATAFYQTLARVKSIALVEATRGGSDNESEEVWKQRIYSFIRRREALLSEDDFESEMKDYLGEGSSALAIGRLKGDRVTYENGYVAVFGLNPDGSQLNTAQITQLQDYLHRKAAMASVNVFSMELFNITIDVVAGVVLSRDPSAIASEIYKTLSEYLLPGKLPPGKPILNKALEFKINAVQGVLEGVVSAKIYGYAQPQALPNIWSVGKIIKCKIALTSSDGQGQSFVFEF